MRNRVIAYLVIGGALAWGMLHPYKNIDKQLQPYYNTYMGLVSLYCPKIKDTLKPQISIYFNYHNDDNWVGICYLYKNKFVVQIDHKYWVNTTEDDRKEIMYHELSHCVLDLDHSPDPKNYMYAYDSHLTITDTINQVISDIKGKCNAGSN